jgi:two-component system, NarL family, invasion response regulator UvrY
MNTFLIADDHEIVRQGLKLLIADFYPGAHILEAHNGDATLAQLKQFKCTLVILDVQMPNTNSLDLVEYISAFHPNTKVLIFSMSSETLYGKRFIKAGADGYLSKDASVEEVKKAIETVLNGRRYISANLIDAFIGEEQKNPFNTLSDREFEIASLLLTGLSINEIAGKIHLQPSTVGTYKARIFEKLHISNILQLKEQAALYNFS